MIKNIITGWGQILISVLSTIILTPLIINSLGRENYGIWIIVFNILGYLYLADFGLTNSISRVYSKYNALKDLKALGMVISSSYLIVVVLDLVIVITGYFASDYVFSFLELSQSKKEIFTFLFFIGLFEVITQLIIRVNVGILQGIHKFYVSYSLDFFAILSRFILVSICIYFNKLDIYLLSIIYVGSQFLFGLGSFYYIKKELRNFTNKFEKVILYQMFSLGTSSLVISLSATLYNSLPILLYGKFFSVENIVLYSIPLSLMMLLSKFINIIFVAYSPKVSELKTLKNELEISNISRFNQKISLFLNSIILVFFILFSHELIVLWLGSSSFTLEEFEEMYNILILLIAYLALSNLQKINNIIYKSAGLHWLVTVEMVLSVLILYIFVLIAFDYFLNYIFAIGMFFVGIFKYLFYHFVRKNGVPIVSYSLSFILFLFLFYVGVYFISNEFSLDIYSKIIFLLILYMFTIYYFYKIELNEEEKKKINLIITKKLKGKV